MKMFPRALVLAALMLTLHANAVCVNDAPEIGDIGPASELVCGELERLFPGSALAVENRKIHSPAAVSVLTSADGMPLAMRYELVGLVWHLVGNADGIAHRVAARDGLSAR
jgi:hypothetical protein